MSRIGNPYDKAKAERFMRTLKEEEVDDDGYRDAVAAGARPCRNGIVQPDLSLIILSYPWGALHESCIPAFRRDYPMSPRRARDDPKSRRLQEPAASAMAFGPRQAERTLATNASTDFASSSTGSSMLCDDQRTLMAEA